MNLYGRNMSLYESFMKLFSVVIIYFIPRHIGSKILKLKLKFNF